MLSVLLLIILSILLALFAYVKKQQSFWAEHGIPHEDAKFPMGHLSTHGEKENLLIRIAKYYFKGKNTGYPFYGLYFLHRPVVLATDLNFIRAVMIKDFNSFVNRGEYLNEKDNPLSAHLGRLESNRWRDMRSRLSPSFTSGKMKVMFPTVVSVAERLVECVRDSAAADSEVEIRDIMVRYTTDVIGCVAFGIECNSLQDPDNIFRKMGKMMIDVPKWTPFGRTVIGIFKPVAALLGIRVHHKEVTEFFMSIVKNTVEYREKNKIQRNDYMDHLIQLKNKEDADERLEFKDIAPQAFSFLAAGFKTSSALTTFVLYELAQDHNQHIQERARKEIEAVIAKHKGEFTYEAMHELTYFDQIINETLRKYPAAGGVSRVANADYQYGDMKFTIPKGMKVFIPIYGIHHDPEYYPNPDNFDPDRFLPSEIAKRPSNSYMPFGDGPRFCIGKPFGKIQARIGLALLLKSFKFSTCARTEPQPMEFSPVKVILSPVGGVWLKIEPVGK